MSTVASQQGEARADRGQLRVAQRPRRRGERRSGYTFLLPTLLLIGFFSYYPAIKAAITAFTNWDGFNSPSFVGWQNFVHAFQDPQFVQSIRNVAIWTGVGIPLAVIPSFLVAELIFHLRSEKLQYMWRTVFVIPLVIPGLVNVLIWENLFQPAGAINVFLKDVGLGSYAHAWIGDPQFALGALIFLGFPWVGSFNLLIFYAGLRSIPTEVFDAAAVDGARRFRRLLKIDIPMTLGQWKLLVVLSIIAVTQNLLTPLLLTAGGPAGATETPVLYMYQQAISYGNYGYAMSIATMLFVTVLILSIINLKYFRADPYAS